MTDFLASALVGELPRKLLRKTKEEAQIWVSMWKEYMWLTIDRGEATG